MIWNIYVNQSNLYFKNGVARDKKITTKSLNAFLFTRKKTKQKQNADHFLFEKEWEEAKLVNSQPCLRHVTFATRMKIQYMNCYKDN